MAGRDLSAELFGDVSPGGRDLSSELFGDAKPVTTSDKFVKGLRDPIDGSAQFLTSILPDSVVKAGNSLNNWIADKTGLVGKLPEGGVDQQVREQEAQYQAKRASAGESGFDGMRVFGNIVNPANLALAAKAPQAATLLGRMALGAGGGGVSALMNPVTEGDDYTSEKLKQVAAGMAGGAAVPAVTGALARVISPNASTNANLALLKSEGVKPTIGQSLGGWANRLEEKLQSAPIVGDAITAARNRASDDLNRAAINRSLATIGKELPEGVTGNEAVLFARKSLGDAYDSILPKMTVSADGQFINSTNSLRGMVNQGSLSNGTRKQFSNFMSNEVEPLFQGNASMTGETLKRLQSKITEQIKRTQASTNADERLLSDAYRELGSQLGDLSVRTNPTLAPVLKDINSGWANFKRVQRAASSVAAEDGVFTPAQLHNAVKAMDRSKDKARFSEGNSLMQDLSSAGKTLLSNKVPNSGTAERLLLNGGALSSGMINPAIPIGLTLGAGMYTSPMQRLLTGAVSSRPELAQPVSNMLRQTAPALIPSGGQIGLGLLN